MPAIIDANQMHKCTNSDREVAPLLKAIIERRCKLVYGGTKLVQEYSKNSDFFKLIGELTRAGLAVLHPAAPIDDLEISIVTSGSLESDDPHIIALAQCTNGRLLVTNDELLKRDFKKKGNVDNPRGKIYNLRSASTLIKEYGL